MRGHEPLIALRRRGLKLLSELREQYGRRLVVNSTRYDGNGVDDKLLLLTADTGGTLLTADYNLAKVAEVQELKVLNLSELVIALRPEVQPGDELNLKIVREENLPVLAERADGGAAARAPWRAIAPCTRYLPPMKKAP